MNLFRTAAAAFSMFSVLPMPNIEWNGKTMRYMLCAFPLVGAAIGALLWGWCALCGWLKFGDILFAAGVTALPIAFSGGIHLDGLMDVSDALAAHAEPEKRRAILKDPHTGAFATIAVLVYIMAYFALASELPAAASTALILGLMHFLSRALSGLCALLFPANQEHGLLHGFRELADKRGAAILLIIGSALASAALIYLSPIRGAAMLFSALACAACLYLIAKRKFAGMSGDLSGWFLQIAELFMLAAYVIVERITAL